MMNSSRPPHPGTVNSVPENGNGTTLCGEVTRIVYENSDGSYAVLRLTGDDGKEHTVRGPLGGVVAGQHLELTGAWERHAEFGRQFKASCYKVTLPATAAGLKRFLGSGAIPGIGKKSAELIVDYFGDQTLIVLDRYSKRLQEVPLIGPKKAEAIIRGWRESAARRDGYIFLQGLGITPAYCAKLFKRYGEAAPEVVRQNPYRLAEEVDGIGFLKADEIARALGIAPDSPDRMTAAAVYVMNTLIGNGNVCAPETELERRAAELTRQTPETVRDGLGRALERRLLRRLDGMIYTPLLARAETELPELVAALATVKQFSGTRLRPVPGARPITLNEQQQRAVEQLSAAPLSIITGGPGVGKTTVIGEIVRRARGAGVSIALAAPTGRAAKRLSESTGMTAKTLHRLLMFDPATGKFGCDRSSPLNCELLIVDEVSMLDLLLAQALFRAIKPGTSVILVGDADQLPSVGAGTVFADFLSSGWFAVTELTEIFRQAAGSRIIVNAHRVNSGLLPEKQPPESGLGDFYWIAQDDPERALELIEILVAERIPCRFGFDPVDDIQVLTPMNRGSCGTQSINERLAARLNGGDKPAFTFGGQRFKVGDKIMQTANNYDKNVFNGDLGRIQKIDTPKKTFLVLFDETHLVEYKFEEADQLSCAYAVTVHKSQGCEFPVVVLPLLTQHYMMLQRNLLYTAMTRAKKLLILIGSARAVRLAVENTRMEPRFSLLNDRMRLLREKYLSIQQH